MSRAPKNMPSAPTQAADSSGLPVTLADVRAAAATIHGSVVATVCSESRTLGEIGGCRLWLKFENLQFTSSFKERGAFNRLSALSPDERRRGVIAMSAGNHAQGVAYHARRLGIPATIVMPSGTPMVKIENTRRHGAEVIIHGETVEDAGAFAREHCRTHDLTFVHPYDDLLIMAGQGTVALEILEAVPDLDMLVVPIGGGGLISGVSMAVKSHRPSAKVIGVESSDGPAMQRSLAAGHLETIDCRTIIDGLRVRRCGELNFSVVQRFVDEIVALPDREIFDAMIWVMERCKLVVEGAAAAPVAALLHGLVRLPKGSRVAVVLSGGNVNLDQLRGLSWN